ncbi:AlbA family DNA-binding domain-containing protein [Burkholderia pyrrocinia]|uniref:ATP-binding protein n=1 Tax=Burkholderia pyrrocinia TaxID=60550 RepID=A0ABZ3BCG4_BURPY
MDAIEQIIMAGRETKSLDYKASTLWSESDKKACCSLVKDVLAFANSGGGAIVIGVEERNTGFDWVGMPSDHVASFETTRFNQFVQNYADPPINCTIVKREVDGRHYVVIEIPPFPDTPHICQKDFQGVLQGSFLYVRTDNNQSAPVKSSSDFRDIVTRAVRQRSDTLLESFRAILVGANVQADPHAEDEEKFSEQLAALRRKAVQATHYTDAAGGTKYHNYLETWSYPSRYEKARFTLDRIKQAVRGASAEYRGWPFLFYATSQDIAPKASEVGVEMGYRWTDFLKVERADYWCVCQSGLLYQRALAREEGRAKANEWGSVLDIDGFIMYVAEALKAVTELYEPLLDPAELLTIAIQVEEAQGRSLVNLRPTGIPLLDHYQSAMKSITYRNGLPLAEWRSGLVDHVQTICKYVFERFNWDTPNLGLVKHIAESLLARKLR